MIYDPLRDELFAARRGGGRALNGATIKPSEATSLANSTVEVGWNMRAGAPNISISCAASRSGARRPAHRLRRARPRLCRRRPARRLCRAPHQRLGLSRRHPARARGRRLCQRLPRRRGALQRQSADRLRAGDPGRASRRGRHRGDRAVSGRSNSPRGRRAPRSRSRGRGAPLEVGGRELLWPGDPAIWGEISPILYPVVGWTRDGARVGGPRNTLSACTASPRSETFAVEALGPDFARLTLRDNERTRAVYPFAFSLAVEYRLSGRRARGRDRGPQSGRRARALRLRPPPGLSLAARRGGPRRRVRALRAPERAEVPAIAPGGLSATA